jgi:Spy/CpxP family protein refolding chaperone
MKTTHKRLTAITLTALLLVTAGGAMAFGGSHERHGGCDRDEGIGPMERIYRLNDLSSEQKSQLREIRGETHTALREIRNAMQDTGDALRDAMFDNKDLETVRGLAQKQGEQVAKMIVLRAEVRQKVRSILTEEQQQQLRNQPGFDDNIGPRHGSHRF